MRVRMDQHIRSVMAALVLAAAAPLAASVPHAGTAAPATHLASPPPITGTIEEVSIPQPLFHLALNRNGTVWATETNGNTIALLTPTTTTTPAVREIALPTATSLTGEITQGDRGSAWFTESAAGKIGHVAANGSINEYPVSLTQTVPLTAPSLWGIAATRTGVWFSEPRDDRIGRLTANGTATYLPVPTVGAGPFEMAAAPDGSIWFTEYLSGKIGHLTPTSGQPTITEYAVPTANSSPWAICVGPDGAIYFTEATASKIGRFDPSTGSFAEYPTPTANSNPWSIAAGPDGIIWFGEAQGNRIGALVPTSGASPIIEFPLPATSGRPGGISAVKGGAIFAEFNTPKIGAIRLSTR